ncbi:MAG: hypothetical protein ACI9VM_000283 [Candidatus Azotimanducaceae bacterium]|jgi:hypothetical protein
MTLGFTVIGVSTGVLLLLLALFRAEESRNHRMLLSGTRAKLDLAVVWCSHKISYMFRHLGAGVIRVTFHFILHKILSVSIFFLTKIGGYLSHLQLRNKRVAKVMKKKSQDNHLDAIATYKQETALSDEEKRKRRLH